MCEKQARKPLPVLILQYAGIHQPKCTKYSRDHGTWFIKVYVQGIMAVVRRMRVGQQSNEDSNLPTATATAPTEDSEMNGMMELDSQISMKIRVEK